MKKRRRYIFAGIAAAGVFQSLLVGLASGSDQDLMLVNSTHFIPETYEVELTELANGQYVAERIYPDLQEMFDTMREQGIFPVVAAGFRTAEKQQSLMDERVEEFVAAGMTREEAQEEAKNWVAVPGTSEHQLGLAVDINQDVEVSTAEEVYDWLAEHAWEYGFILRYPEDKEEITGISFEPWHYRYVGHEQAEQIYSMGVCLEEYLGETD